MQGDRYFVRIRTSSIGTGQNQSSADTGVMPLYVRHKVFQNDHGNRTLIDTTTV